QVKTAGVLDSFNPNPSQVSTKVKEQTGTADKVFLFQYLSPITDREGLAFQELSKSGFVNTAIYDFQGVGFIYEFKRL
ncbi:MAG: hypothetical protein ACD_57C00318G0001, partial [uncultured bacterium]